MVLKIEHLVSGKHIRANFCCGKKSLDNYIKKIDRYIIIDLI